MAGERTLAPAVSARWHLLELAISFAVLTGLCTLIYKVLPAVIISWRDAAVGGLATAILFSAGAYGIGWYLGMKSTGSAYGAAGSLVALLLWVSYSAQAFFLGAAFARIQAERYGHGLTPAPGAVRMVIETPADE